MRTLTVEQVMNRMENLAWPYTGTARQRLLHDALSEPKDRLPRHVAALRVVGVRWDGQHYVEEEE